MNYKIANILRFILIMIGLCTSGLSVLICKSASNIFFLVGIIIIIAGLLIGFVYYRCPKCGHMLAWRPIILKCCHNCGYKLR